MSATATTAPKKSAVVTFETTTCGRCGGSGSHSYCQMWGSTCFECGGKGRVLSRRGAAAASAFSARRMEQGSLPAEQLVAGDRVIVDGRWRTVTGWDATRGGSATSNGITTQHGLLSLAARGSLVDGFGCAPSHRFITARAERWAEMVAFAHTLPGALIDGEWSDAMRAEEAKSPAQVAAANGDTRRATVAKARRQAARDAEAARVAAAVAALEAEHADLFAACDAMTGDAFVSDVVARARRTGVLTVKQADALRAAVARAAEARAAAVQSAWVGTVGEKLEVPVVVVRCGSFERPSFRYGSAETVHVVTMADAAGNLIVSKSPRFVATVGDRFTLRATVKEHATYRDARQTVVTRAAVRQ